MIYQVSSVNIMPGKDREAEQLMVKIAAIVNQKYPAANSHILRNFDGHVRQIHIVDSWESLGAWEVAAAQVESDPKWQALVQEGAGWLDVTSLQRHFYQVVGK